jgi:protein-tyrosine phosphatase
MRFAVGKSRSLRFEEYAHQEVCRGWIDNDLASLNNAPMQHKRVLFLCTGNYYRSRLAEELFNQRARRLGLNWHASSCALAIERGAENIGQISEFAIKALSDLDVIPAHPFRFPVACTIRDFELADLVIAMKEAEHRPLMKTKFDAWAERVTYWHVHDLDVADFAETTGLVDVLVNELIQAIQAEDHRGGE